jgi:sugar/nucleoside kinase (ribokinase family)
VSKPIHVCGIGNAIVDILSHATDEFVAAHGIVKGSMTLIDAERAVELYDAMGPSVEMSGGTAGNTAAGVASLGGQAAFIGKVRDDQLGAVYRHDIRSLGVTFDVPAASDGPPTAQCFILMHPDAQRTMNTYLGASEHLQLADIDPELIGRCEITYCEGYLWDVDSAMAAMQFAIDTARERGGRASFTLSDSFCVDRHREDFLRLADGGVDILFANDAEIRALYEVDDFDDAVARVQRAACGLAFVTRGPAGSVVVTPDEVIPVAADPVERVVDTTGAGDLYAAGVLYGLAIGREPAAAGALGSLAASEVISHVGPRPEVALKDLAVQAGLI